MSEQIVLYVLSEDVTPADTWRLLSWCHSHGANEFTLALLGPSRLPANAWNHVDTTLAPFASGHAFRDTPGSDDQLQVALWRLTAESIAALGELLREGLFTYEPGDTSLEDPTIYRKGEPMLSIVSHEREGILTIRADERASLDETDVRYRVAGRWS